MRSRILAFCCVLAMSAIAAPVPRVTKQCRSGYLTGEVALRFTGSSRENFVAVAANPLLDPDLYFRLWNPTKARMTSIGSEDYVIFTYDTAQDTAEIARAMFDDTVLRERGAAEAFAGSWGCFGVNPPPRLATITEYHNRFSDHYFLSSSAGENAAIDSGAAGAGWERTGEVFQGMAEDACYSSLPVFRFYGPGPNSHFFTVGVDECGGVRNHDPGWLLEGVAFGARMPVAGACPAGEALYRLYNGRAAQNDSNHRFTNRLDVYEQMKARGWLGEGVAMCLATH